MFYLLVNDNKLLVSPRADLLFEVDDFLHLGVGESSLGLNQLLSLRGTFIEEARVHLTGKHSI